MKPRLASMILLALMALSMMVGQFLIAHRMGRESATLEILTAHDPMTTARAIVERGR